MKTSAGPAKLKKNEVLPCLRRTASVRNFDDNLALYFENKSSPAGRRRNKLKPKPLHSFHCNSHFWTLAQAPRYQENRQAV